MKKERTRPIGQRMETKPCLFCKSFFTVAIWRKAKVCSVKCSNNLPKSRMKGKKVSEVHKKRISEAHKGLRKPWAALKGNLNHNWIKDRTKLVKNEKKHLDGRYREWMKSVKNRDNWKCKIANINCKGRMEAHHILDWKNFPELRYEINNGITLCHAHHPRGRVEEKRLSPYFQELIKKEV